MFNFFENKKKKEYTKEQEAQDDLKYVVKPTSEKYIIEEIIEEGIRYFEPHQLVKWSIHPKDKNEALFLYRKVENNICLTDMEKASFEMLRFSWGYSILGKYKTYEDAVSFLDLYTKYPTPTIIKKHPYTVK